MMSYAGLYTMFAVRAAHAIWRAYYHCRAFVVRLVAAYPPADIGGEFPPHALEGHAVALGSFALEQVTLALDTRGDKILASFLENRSPLVAVGTKQQIAAPPVELRRELPSKIDRVFETIIETEAAIGGVAVRCIT